MRRAAHHAEPKGASYESAIYRIDERPVWAQVLTRRTARAGGEERIRAHAARHPGFAHVLWMLARDDEEEEEEG
jgi:hypothetical protein